MAKPSLDINVDVGKAIKTIQTQFTDLSGAQFERGVLRAINDVMAKGNVEAAKQMRAIYKVKSRDVKRNMKLIRANRRTFTASVNVSTRPLPLISFNARQTRKGVSVNVLGKRKLIKGAFIATMNSGHRGVYARGRYVNHKFVFRDKQLSKKRPDNPIDELVTVSPLSMLTNKKVSKAVERKLTKEFPSTLIRQLKSIRRGF